MASIKGREVRAFGSGGACCSDIFVVVVVEKWREGLAGWVSMGFAALERQDGVVDRRTRLVIYREERNCAYISESCEFQLIVYASRGINKQEARRRMKVDD